MSSTKTISGSYRKSVLVELINAIGARATRGISFALLILLADNSWSDPWQCGEEDVVTLTGVSFGAGDYLSCIARSQIDLGPDVTINGGAELDVRAPRVRFLPEFSVAADGEFSAGPGICGDLVTFESGKAPTQEIHVDVAGVNAPGCGAMSWPCASIEFAATLAGPGTAIVVHEGIYVTDQSIANLAGTPQQPIWIGGAAGELTPILDGGSQGMFLSRVRYLIIHDLIVRNSSSNGINTDDGGDFNNKDATRYVVFRNLLIHSIRGTGNQDCLKISGVDDFWVYDSEFYGCGGGGSGSAIDAVGCHDGVIHGNYIHDQQNGGSGIQCKGGSEDIEIRANLFENAGPRAINMGGSTGLQFFRPPVSEATTNAEAWNIRAVANVFRGSTAPLAFTGCVGCLAANNTIDTPERWVFRILQETTSSGNNEFLPVSNGQITNNIIYFDDQVVRAFNVGPDSAPETFILNSNLWYRYDMPSQSAPPGGTLVVESNPIIGMDPGFANASLGDFHITVSSPAYLSGTILSEISADFDRICYLSPPSRGAFEVDNKPVH